MYVYYSSELMYRIHYCFVPFDIAHVKVINVGTSIGKVGFFGEKFQKLWCLSHIETLRYQSLSTEGS